MTQQQVLLLHVLQGTRSGGIAAKRRRRRKNRSLLFCVLRASLRPINPNPPLLLRASLTDLYTQKKRRAHVAGLAVPFFTRPLVAIAVKR
jgi:hypothetical protein